MPIALNRKQTRGKLRALKLIVVELDPQLLLSAFSMFFSEVLQAAGELSNVFFIAMSLSLRLTFPSQLRS